MTVTKEYLADLQALADAATPGKWSAKEIERELHVAGPGDDMHELVTSAEPQPTHFIGLIYRSNDAAFIAAARTAIPKLIAHIDEQENDRLHYIHMMHEDKAQIKNLQGDLENELKEVRQADHARSYAWKKFHELKTQIERKDAIIAEECELAKRSADYAELRKLCRFMRVPFEADAIIASYRAPVCKPVPICPVCEAAMDIARLPMVEREDNLTKPVCETCKDTREIELDERDDSRNQITPCPDCQPKCAKCGGTTRGAVTGQCLNCHPPATAADVLGIHNKESEQHE